MTEYKGNSYKCDLDMPMEVYVEYYMVGMGFNKFPNRAATVAYIKARYTALKDWTKESRTECNRLFMLTNLPAALAKKADQLNKLYKGELTRNNGSCLEN
jgi:hypothetical protein